MPTPDWPRLAKAVVLRRSRLGLSQIELAGRGAMSVDRVQMIEGAKRTYYRQSTIASLERALDWEHGSVEAVLAGGEPTPRGAVRDKRAEMDEMYGRIKADDEKSDALMAVMKALLDRAG